MQPAPDPPSYNPYSPQGQPQQAAAPMPTYAAPQQMNQQPTFAPAATQAPNVMPGFSGATHQKDHFQKTRSKVSIGLIQLIVLLFTTLLLSSGSTYFLMGGALFSDSTPSEYEGKWYGGSAENHMWFADDGEMLEWDEPRFSCISGGNVPADYVNDDDADCPDGSDEGTKAADSFNPSRTWISAGNGYGDEDGWSFSQTWAVEDDRLCIKIFGSSSSASMERASCMQAEIVGEALWVAEGTDNDGVLECEVALGLGGRESGPMEYSSAWVDTWNFALEDAYPARPSFCTATTFNELKQNYDDEYYYY